MSARSVKISLPTRTGSLAFGSQADRLTEELWLLMWEEVGSAVNYPQSLKTLIVQTGAISWGITHSNTLLLCAIQVMGNFHQQLAFIEYQSIANRMSTFNVNDLWRQTEAKMILLFDVILCYNMYCIYYIMLYTSMYNQLQNWVFFQDEVLQHHDWPSILW